MPLINKTEMINQIGCLKLNIDQQTGEFVWAYDYVKIYATRTDDPWDRWVNLRIWAMDDDGKEYESDGDGFMLSKGTMAEQMAEYIEVVRAIEKEIDTYYFWQEGILNLDSFKAYVFSQKINKFLVK